MNVKKINIKLAGNNWWLQHIWLILTYSSTFAKDFLFIRRKKQAISECSFITLAGTLYHHAQKMRARHKPVTQALQQDQVPHDQNWGTNSDDVCVGTKHGHCHRSVYCSWFQYPAQMREQTAIHSNAEFSALKTTFTI